MAQDTLSTVRSTPGHTVARVKPGLWQVIFHYPAATNAWLWQERDGLTLIDAGHPWNARALEEAAEYIGQPLRRIVLTHAHPDHAGAASQLAKTYGAQVLAHEADVPFLTGEASMSDSQGFWLCRTVLGAGKHLGILRPPRIQDVIPLSEGDSVGRLQVLHTPGHTPGSISLWSEQDKAVFCGDNVCPSLGRLHIGLPWFTLDLSEQRKSVQRYVDLPAELLLSGHGPVFRGNVSEAVRRLL